MSRIQMRHPVEKHAVTEDTPVDEYIPPPDYSAWGNLMAVPPGIIMGFANVLQCNVCGWKSLVVTVSFSPLSHVSSAVLCTCS